MSELHVGDMQVPQQHHDGVLVGVPAEVGPRVLRQHLVALQEAVVALAGREARAPDAHVLHQAQVGHLVTDLGNSLYMLFLSYTNWLVKLTERRKGGEQIV